MVTSIRYLPSASAVVGVLPHCRMAAGVAAHGNGATARRWLFWETRGSPGLTRFRQLERGGGRTLFGQANPFHCA